MAGFLGLMIINPLCCCLGHQELEPRPDTASCCHEADADSTAPAEEEPCECHLTPEPRALADVELKKTALVQVPLALVTFELPRPEALPQKAGALLRPTATGPPGRDVCEWYCVLLI